MPTAARLPPGEIGYVELGGLPDHPFRYLGEDGEIKIHSRGRFRTGDLGCLDADGFLMLTGREKEQIIRGGAKISPVEIDSFLMQHADVIEAATVGVPDAIYGEEVVSYVVTRPGAPADADELLRYCAARCRPSRRRSGSCSPTRCRRPNAASSTARRWRRGGRRRSQLIMGTMHAVRAQASPLSRLDPATEPRRAGRPAAPEDWADPYFAGPRGVRA